MASCSTYLANKILDYVFGKVAWEPADTLYLGFLSSPANSDGSGGTELTGDNYSRIALDNDLVTFLLASARQKLNDIEIPIPTPSADWLGIVGWKLWDASSGGNVYTFGRTLSPIYVKQGEPRKIPLAKFVQNLT